MGKSKISGKTLKDNLKKGIAGFTILSVLAGGYLLLSTASSKHFTVPYYEVSRVIDGDTFQTKDGQLIRVGSTQSPEKGLCGSEEARKALEKLVLGKPVYLKVTFLDIYKRLVSLVYTPDYFVNEEMLKGGYSYYYRSSPGDIGETLMKAGDAARNKKIGIFSNKCTQMTNTGNPRCNIKGNTRNGNIYYLPDCGVYHNVEVQLYLGDKWFCSEKEVIAAGYRKPSQCI